MGVHGFSSKVLKVQNKLTIACKTIVNRKLCSVNEQHSAPSWVSVKSPTKAKGWFQIVISITRQSLAFDVVPHSQLSGWKQVCCEVPLGHSSPALASPQISAALAALIRRGATSGYSSALFYRLKQE